ncbi:MFS transporter [Lentzea sp. NPDC051838]|uniref:MFS transporter n=1 Tax=Lentzea sp. NPDC051838 TaxID=3154849 RepID=UPI00341E7F35
MTAAAAETRQDQTWAPFAPTVWLLAPLGIVVVGQMYTVIAMLPSMAVSYGTTAGSLAWLASAFGIAYAAGFLVAGPATDSYGPRTVITAGLIATAVATALVPWAPNLLVTGVLRVLQGATAACFVPAAFAYVTDRIEPSRRAVALTWITGGSIAATVLMQLTAQVISSALSWRAVFLLSAAAMLACVPVVRAVLRPSTSAGSPNPRAAFVAMAGLLARPRLLVGYVLAMVLMSSFVGIYTIVTLAGPATVAGDPTALLILRASALPAVVAVPLLTPKLVRLSQPARVIGGGVLALVTVLAAALWSTNVVALGVFLLFFVAAVAATSPALIEFIAGQAGQAKGAAVALYAFLLFVGASLGPVLVGAVAGWGFTGVLFLFAGLIAAATAAITTAFATHRA